MLEQAKRPEHKPTARLGEDQEYLARRPAERVDAAPSLEAPPGGPQAKRSCSACGGGASGCPKCGSETPNLEVPPRIAARAPEDRAGAAERQADELGALLAQDLPRNAARGGAISSGTREAAEARLGVSLAGTEVDGGASGASKARAHQALAVAEGSEIAFGQGELQDDARGRFLLGHELVHVAQQRAAGRDVPQRVAKGEGSASEQEAKDKVTQLPPEKQRGIIQEITDILDGKLLTASSGTEEWMLRSAWTSFGEGKAFELAAAGNLPLWVRTRRAYPSLGDELEKPALRDFTASITSQASSHAKANEDAARKEMARFGIREDEPVVSEAPPEIANPVAAMTLSEDQKTALKDTTELVRTAVDLERAKKGMLGTPVGVLPYGIAPPKPPPAEYTGKDVPIPQDTFQPLFALFKPEMLPPVNPLKAADGETTLYEELKVVWATTEALLASIKASSPAVFALTEKQSGKTVMPPDPEKEPASVLKALQSQLHLSRVNAEKLQKEIKDGNFRPELAHQIQDGLIETEEWSGGFRGYVAGEYIKKNRGREKLPLALTVAYTGAQMLSPDPGVLDVGVVGLDLHGSRKELNQLQMMRGAQIRGDIGLVYKDQITSAEAKVEADAIALKLSAVALAVGLVTLGAGDALVTSARKAKAASDAAKLRVLEARTAALERRFAKEFKDSPELRKAGAAIRDAKNAEEASLEFEKLSRRLRVTETQTKDSTALTNLELDNELRYLNDNPHLVRQAPDGLIAKLGKHEWRQRADGWWCRFTKPNCRPSLAGADNLVSITPPSASAGGGVGIPTRPTATHPKLKNALHELWRAEDKLPGGTAGALRHELPRGDTKHVMKAQERIKQLQKILKDPSLSPADRVTAQRVIDDLQDALTTPKGKP